jgi:predicted double-glycine peptidase
LQEVRQFADKKHPVIVLVQAWAEKHMTLEDWRQGNDNGHYVVIIAHSDGVIVFEDPASFRKTWMTEEEFMNRWHDIDPRTGRKVDRFGLVMLGKGYMPLHKKFEHTD